MSRPLASATWTPARRSRADSPGPRSLVSYAGNRIAVSATASTALLLENPQSIDAWPICRTLGRGNGVIRVGAVRDTGERWTVLDQPRIRWCLYCISPAGRLSEGGNAHGQASHRTGQTVVRSRPPPAGQDAARRTSDGGVPPPGTKAACCADRAVAGLAVDIGGRAEVQAQGPPLPRIGSSIDWLPEGPLITTGPEVTRLEPDGNARDPLRAGRQRDCDSAAPTLVCQRLRLRLRRRWHAESCIHLVAPDGTYRHHFGHQFPNGIISPPTAPPWSSLNHSPGAFRVRHLR